MGMSAGGDSEYNSDINVTPMVDIMLVLLIIFMVVTPLLQQGVSVTLPKGNTPDEDTEITKESSVVMAIPNDDEFYIGKDRFSKEVLGEKINKLMEGKTPDKRIVYIKSSVGVSYGTVVEAINIIRKQDVDKIGLVADKNKAGAAPAGS
jgi:biopolymer transport protein TolR